MLAGRPEAELCRLQRDLWQLRALLTLACLIEPSPEAEASKAGASKAESGLRSNGMHY